MNIPKRRLGRTGLEISTLGFGGWGIAGADWGETSDDESVRALEAAIEAGVNFIDTALAYGPNHSEQVIGRVVNRRPEEVYVATKVPVPDDLAWPIGPNVHVGKVFSAAHIRNSAERSLANLGVETIDLLQLHAWRDEWLGEGDWEAAVADLKQEGKIRFFGVSINDHEPENAMAAAAAEGIETVQVIYNIFEAVPEGQLLPACEASDVGVIARVPFDEGALTGRIGPGTEFEPGDWRRYYFSGERLSEVDARIDSIAADLEIERTQLPEVALRFSLSPGGVTTTIAGMRSTRHVESNVAAAQAGPLDASMLAILRKHRWAKNFYEP